MTERDTLRPLSDSQRETLEEATAAYESAVTAGAARFLLDRGISEAVAATFRLGVVGDDPHPGHDRYKGFLAIPYLDQHGRPLSIRFRCLQEHDHRDFGHGKYMSMTDEPSRVYNIAAIHNADDTIHVTEGELDALILTMLGFPAIAIPGASGWQRHHRRMLAGFNRIWVWGDPDDAGSDFNNRVVRAMKNAKAVRLRDGDVNETYLAGGVDALHALIESEV